MKHPVIITLEKISKSFSRLAVGISASALLLVTGTQSASAYATSCLTNVLPINTGVNTYTGAMLPIGSQDPAWRVVGLTSTLTPPTGQTIPYPAYTVLGNPAWQYPWPISTTSNWISFNTYSSYSTLAGPSYSMTLRRTFKTCVSDKLNIVFSKFSFDQTIQVSVDGAVVYTNTNAAQYQSFTTATFAATPSGSSLPAGTHNIDIIVYNNAGNYSDDGHGLNITGNVVSINNVLSIVSEAAGCEKYVCGQSTLMSQEVSNTKSVLYQNAPNPFNDATKISYFVKDMKSSANIAVYDMNGKEVLRLPISKTGEGNVSINRTSLQPGMYSYSLLIDGAVTDTKRMVIIP